jgi:hypothetical protein
VLQEEGDGVSLDNDRTIPAMREDDPYKYLGIEQTLVSDPRAVKERLRAEYLSRLKRVWSSEMNAKNKVNATNIWPVSLFRYYFGVLA